MKHKGIYPESKKLPNIKNNMRLEDYGIKPIKIKYKKFYCMKCKSMIKLYSINTNCKYCGTKLIDYISREERRL